MNSWLPITVTFFTFSVSHHPSEENNQVIMGTTDVYEGFNEALFHPPHNKRLQSLGWEKWRGNSHHQTDRERTALFKTDLLYCIFSFHSEREKGLWNKRRVQQAF